METVFRKFLVSDDVHGGADLAGCLMLGAACTNLASAAICSTPQVGCFVLVLLTLVVTLLITFIAEVHGLAENMKWDRVEVMMF